MIIRNATFTAALLWPLVLAYQSQAHSMASDFTCERVVNRLESRETDGDTAAATFKDFPDLTLLTNASRETCAVQGCLAVISVVTPFQRLNKAEFTIDKTTSVEIRIRNDVPPVDLLNRSIGPTMMMTLYATEELIEATVTPADRLLGVTSEDVLAFEFEPKPIEKERTHFYTIGSAKNLGFSKPSC